MITLVLPYPISANRYWASRVIKAKATGKWLSMTYVTPEAEAWKSDAAWRAKKQGLLQPIVGRVSVDLRLYPHRPQDWQRRVRKDPMLWDDTVQCLDLDNARKVLYDALKGVAFTDDSRVFAESGARMEPDGIARVVVTVAPFVRDVDPQGDLLAAALPLPGPAMLMEKHGLSAGELPF